MSRFICNPQEVISDYNGLNPGIGLSPLDAVLNCFILCPDFTMDCREAPNGDGWIRVGYVDGLEQQPVEFHPDLEADPDMGLHTMVYVDGERVAVVRPFKEVVK